MKKCTFFAICSILLGVFLLTDLIGAAKWEKVKSDSGITVYTRDVEGSDLDEFRGITVIDKNITVIMAVLQDIPAQTSWMHNCIAAKLIEKKSDYVRIVYNATDVTWPVTDRDVVVKSTTKIEPSKGRVITTIQSINDPRVPPKSGFQRMKSLNGSWSLYYLGENKTRVIYQIKANPGGSVPASLANMSSKKIPYHTLLGLRKMASKSKYTSEAADIQKRIKEAWKAGK